MIRKRYGMASALLILASSGCGTSKSTAPADPVAIRADAPGVRTFEAGAAIPPASFAFEGASGFVRVTIEAEVSSPGGRTSALNDVLFTARGAGRITLSFRKPWPGHDEGRVTVRCEAGSEDSTADFEPTLWFRDAGAVVAFEAPASASIGPVVEGSEVILARYAAKVGDRAVGLTVRATFAREPLPVRVQGRAEGL